MSATQIVTKARKKRRPYRRDPQAERFYDAEVNAHGGIVVDLPELDDVRAYVRKVERDRWFRRHFGVRRFRVTDGRGLHKSVANGGGREIAVSRAGRARWVVLHELAHCLTVGLVQWHGPEFVSVYLKLVRHFLGRDAWRALYRACKDRKVKTQKRRRAARTMTEEQRALLAARLADARAAARTRTATPTTTQTTTPTTTPTTPEPDA